MRIFQRLLLTLALKLAICALAEPHRVGNTLLKRTCSFLEGDQCFGMI